jgi:hypothetical protein
MEFLEHFAFIIHMLDQNVNNLEKAEPKELKIEDEPMAYDFVEHKINVNEEEPFHVSSQDLNYQSSYQTYLKINFRVRQILVDFIKGKDHIDYRSMAGFKRNDLGKLD